jgi:hypothetical protein
MPTGWSRRRPPATYWPQNRESHTRCSDVKLPKDAPNEHQRIACNFSKNTQTAIKGSLAFVLLPNGGSLHDRLFVLSRSRGGRWIRKWESIKHLANFRKKTIPRDSPLYEKLIDGCDETALISLTQAAAIPTPKP